MTDKKRNPYEVFLNKKVRIQRIQNGRIFWFRGLVTDVTENSVFIDDIKEGVMAISNDLIKEVIPWDNSEGDSE